MTFARSAVVATRSRNARSSLGLWIGARATDVPVATAMASPTSNGVTPFVTLPPSPTCPVHKLRGGERFGCDRCHTMVDHRAGSAVCDAYLLLTTYRG